MNGAVALSGGVSYSYTPAQDFPPGEGPENDAFIFFTAIAPVPEYSDASLRVLGIAIE